MRAITHNRENEFHWTAPELFLSFLMGVLAVAGLWLFAGLMIMLFLM